MVAGRSLLNGREIHWADALGRGGQSVRIVPELDLVVVVTAGYYQSVSSAVRHFQGCLAGDLAPLPRGAAKGANASIAVANATVTPAAQLGP